MQNKVIDAEITNVKSALTSDVTGIKQGVADTSITFEWEQGSIDSSTGLDISSDDSIRTANYYPSTEGLTISIPAGFRYRLLRYDANKNFIDSTSLRGGATATNETLAISASAFYRLSFKKYPSAAIGIAEGYNCVVYSGQYRTGVEENKAACDELNRIIDYSRKFWNLWGVGTLSVGYAVTSTGGITANSEYTSSDFIPVHGVKVIYGNYGARYCYYDANKGFLRTANFNSRPELITGSGIKYSEIASDVYYLRICIDNTYLPDAFLFATTKYEDYLKDELSKIVTPENFSLYCIGDSITRGMYTDIGDTSSKGPTQYGYPYWIGYINNYTVTNLGESSGGFVKKGDNNHNIKDIVDGNSFDDADFVTIAFGINDWKDTSGSIQLGSVDTSLSGDGTVIGNMMYGIETIMSKNPSSNIIVLLPLNQTRFLSTTEMENWSFNHINNGKTLADYREAIQACAEHYNIQVLDPYTLCAINRINIGTCLGDGLHPTLAFYKQMGITLANYIH